MTRILVLLYFLFLVVFPPISFAQILTELPQLQEATEASSSASSSAVLIKKTSEKDVTEPEQKKEKEELLTLLEKRNVRDLSFWNVLPYAEAYAIRAGVPANTIILIMLLPVLATLIVAVRYIVGLTSMGLLVPIALSITLLATGVIPGLIMLVSILLASSFARITLKKVRIMQMPKMALSMLLVCTFLFITLAVSAQYALFDVKDISIFPILLLILLSDRIVALFLERNVQESIEVICVTLILSMIGFLLLDWPWLRNMFFVYPELILFIIPTNILIGRYFGLRMTEYIKFQPVLKKK